MKKFIGFGLLLTLIVAYMGTASAQLVPPLDCNFYPVVPSSVGTYSSFLGVTNLSGVDLDGEAPGTAIVVTRIFSGVTPVETLFAVDGFSTIFIEPSSISCNSGSVCQVAVEAPAAIMTSLLFWTNDGVVIAITAPNLCGAV